MTPEDFKALTGREPEQDDLERANCPEAGQITHSSCGVCELHNKPRFLCGCMLWPSGYVQRFGYIDKPATSLNAALWLIKQGSAKTG